ncbi:MAG: hypothetical protein RI885_2789 [Actinomycetota bacterium]|jgi:hypothetical protein
MRFIRFLPVVIPIVMRFIRSRRSGGQSDGRRS